MQVMQWITAAILAAFVGYIAAWYTGSIEGNFALLLFLATVVTGGYWLAERFIFLPKRRAAAAALEQGLDFCLAEGIWMNVEIKPAAAEFAQQMALRMQAGAPE